MNTEPYCTSMLNTEDRARIRIWTAFFSIYSLLPFSIAAEGIKINECARFPNMNYEFYS